MYVLYQDQLKDPEHINPISESMLRFEIRLHGRLAAP